MISHLKAFCVPDDGANPPLLLCVDDARILLLALANVLSRHGYDVIATDNTEEALKVLEEYCIDAIITDYEMPDMDGGRFASRVKTRHLLCPILLHSGLEAIPAWARQYMDAIVPKNQPVELFLAGVDSLFEGGAMRNRKMR